jgi:hypothetical protein
VARGPWRVSAPVHQEQGHYRAMDSLKPYSHYTSFATHGELKCSRLNVISVVVRKMDGARSDFSHGSLAVIKWTVCRHRETICLPEARRETDAVPLEMSRVVDGWATH